MREQLAVQARGAGAGGAAAVAWQRVSRRRVAAAGVARAKGARGSGVRGNDSARLKQTRDRQQEKGKLCRTMTRSCTACRTTVCWEVTRGAGGVAVRRLQADPHRSSGTARGERRKPSRRRQWKAQS
jgi:hypothetical protein